MKLTTKQIATTALLLAICIMSQFFKNLIVYIKDQSSMQH